MPNGLCRGTRWSVLYTWLIPLQKPLYQARHRSHLKFLNSSFIGSLLTLPVTSGNNNYSLNPILRTANIYMGGFAQFGLNGFQQVQQIFSQLQLSLDTDKLKSWNFMCSSITARRGFAEIICRDYDHCKCPKVYLKHWCIFYEDLTKLTWIQRYVKLTEVCLTLLKSI